MAQPTVLVLDGELGFMFALSQELSKRHIAAFPSRTAREARSLITRFRLEPEVLVINCGSPGACALAEGVAKERRDVQIIGVISDRFQCRKCAALLAAQFRDPEDQSPERIPHCADVIQALLREQRRRARHAGGN
jgi:cobyrinic acid a,c-diamide synthase